MKKKRKEKNARITKCTAAFNTKIVNLWIKVCNEKAVRTYRFSTNSCCFFTDLRVNITIVYEHTVCATSAFSMCMLRVVFNVVPF